MKPVTSVFYADLLPKIEQNLLEILQMFNPEDWHKPTIVSQWQIKDIVTYFNYFIYVWCDALRNHMTIQPLKQYGTKQSIF